MTTTTANTYPVRVVNDVWGTSGMVEVEGSREQVIGRLFLAAQKARRSADFLKFCVHVTDDRITLHWYARTEEEAVFVREIMRQAMQPAAILPPPKNPK